MKDGGKLDQPRACQKTPAGGWRQEARGWDHHVSLGPQEVNRALIGRKRPRLSPREHPSALPYGLRCGKGLS